MAGVLLSLFLLPPRYKATTKILVKRERADFVVTPDTSDTQQQPPAAVSETDLNSEIELMKSQDLLEKVVTACGLQKPVSRSSWFTWLHFSSGAEDSHKLLTAAVRDLERSMDLGVLPKTSLISVTLRGFRSPAGRSCARHICQFLYGEASGRAPAGRNLGVFSGANQAIRGGLESSRIPPQRIQPDSKERFRRPSRRARPCRSFPNFKGIEGNTGGNRGNQQRIQTLENQASTVPSRLTTQVRTADNPQLMEQLKSTLLNLELKRTELLQKFDPSYRLVQEVDTEIKQTQAAIDSAGKSKLMDETTDSNPTYQWVDSELAKAQSQLSAEQARAAGSIAQRASL